MEAYSNVCPPPRRTASSWRWKIIWIVNIVLFGGLAYLILTGKIQVGIFDNNSPGGGRSKEPLVANSKGHGDTKTQPPKNSSQINHFSKLPENYQKYINGLPSKLKDNIKRKIDGAESIQRAKQITVSELEDIMAGYEKSRSQLMTLMQEYNINVNTINQLIPPIKGMEEWVTLNRQFTGPETIAKLDLSVNQGRLSLSGQNKEAALRRESIDNIHNIMIQDGYFSEKLLVFPTNEEALAAVQSGKAPLPLDGSNMSVMLPVKINNSLLEKIDELTEKYKSLPALD